MTHDSNAIVKLAMVFSLVLLTCASGMSAAESSFNSGVAAYKKKNYEEAFSHWSQAAARGNVHALNNLGFLLHSGYGIEKNVNEAVSVWRTAAFAGESESQWHLGHAYEDGDGVKQDRSRAYAWYRCAIASARRKLTGDDGEMEAQIFKDARASLEKLTRTLTENELDVGKTLAKEYISRYGKPPP